MFHFNTRGALNIVPSWGLVSRLRVNFVVVFVNSCYPVLLWRYFHVLILTQILLNHVVIIMAS